VGWWAGLIRELRAADPPSVGPYRLLGRLGTGGMGQVYLAGSPGGRLVAIKVIRPELAEEPGFRARFAHEVAAARNVSGMFTAAVVDADPDAELPWMATAYVPGPSLGDAVDDQGPLPVASVLVLAAGLAEALQAIHRAGVVHRDLKPSNVLLAADGPRVIDFGISRAREHSRLTTTGAVMGSPGFLSLEQAVGLAVGPPSDVFSLGAVLAFAATGDSPFGSGPTPALLYRVVNQPADLSDVPDRLRPLIEHCLAKEPASRPESGELLAQLSAEVGVITVAWLPQQLTDTLARYVPPITPAPPEVQAIAWAATASAALVAGSGKPVSADPEPKLAAARATSTGAGTQVGFAGRKRRLPRRSWPAIGATAAVAVAVAATLAALHARDHPPVFLGASTPGIGATTGRPADPATTGHPPSPAASPADSPSAALHVSNSPIATLGDLSSKTVASVAFSPDGKAIAAGDWNGNTYLWDVSSYSLIETLTGTPTKSVFSVAFSPDGKTIAAGADNTYLWDVSSHSLIATLTDPSSSGIESVAFSPSGKTIAVGDANGGTYLWDVSRHSLIGTLFDTSGRGVFSVTFSPSGKTIAVGDGNGGIYLWRASSQSLIATLTDPSSNAIHGVAVSVAFSPDGKTIAASEENGHTYLWNVSRRSLIATLTDPSGLFVRSLAFSPDGRTVVAGDANGNTYLWDVSRRSLIATLTYPSSRDVYSVAFSPDGKIIAAANSNGSTYMWLVS
jgi:Protein kinase domain/WD domain, G-beta repeat